MVRQIMVRNRPATDSGTATADGRGNGLGRISGATVEGEHHDDRRSDRGQSGVRRDGGADVSPAKGHHLERTAQEDALLKVTGYETDKRACHERLMELELIQNAFHTGKQRDNRNKQNSDCRHVSDPPLLCLSGQFALAFFNMASRSSENPKEPCGPRT